jgi:hypothetical protein
MEDGRHSHNGGVDTYLNHGRNGVQHRQRTGHPEAVTTRVSYSYQLKALSVAGVAHMVAPHRA